MRSYLSPAGRGGPSAARVADTAVGVAVKIGDGSGALCRPA